MYTHYKHRYDMNSLLLYDEMYRYDLNNLLCVAMSMNNNNCDHIYGQIDRIMVIIIPVKSSFFACTTIIIRQFKAPFIMFKYLGRHVI